MRRRLYLQERLGGAQRGHHGHGEDPIIHELEFNTLQAYDHELDFEARHAYYLDTESDDGDYQVHQRWNTRYKAPR